MNTYILSKATLQSILSGPFTNMDTQLDPL